MIKQKLIIISGYPGSGKTTVGKLLAKKNCGIFIDHNEILTFLAKIIGDDEGIYEEIHALERAMAQKLLSNGKDTIVARGFSKESSVDAYINAAKETLCDVYVIRLDVSTSNLLSRVVAEERKEDFNPTINERSLSKWITENPLEAIAGEYVINADEPLERVVREIISILGSRPAG